MLSPSDFGKFKREAAERAEKRAAEKREADAKAAGFPSYAAMLDAAKGAKAAARANNGKGKPANAPTASATVEPAASPGGATVPKREFERVVREKSALEDKLRTTLRDRARLDKQLRDLKRESADAAGTYELKLTAVQLGIVDPDYAVHLLKQKAGLTRKPDETPEAYYQRLEQFDERKFFEELRTSNPHLWSSTEQPKPATTGNAGNVLPGKGPDAKPAEAKPAADPARGPTKKASEQTPDEFEKRLSSLGLQNPATGSY